MIFKIYEINYETSFEPKDTAIVSADSPKNASHILEAYLKNDPAIKPGYEISYKKALNFKGTWAKETNFLADREGVIFPKFGEDFKKRFSL